MFMMQLMEKIMPNIGTGMNVSDFPESSKPPLLEVTENIDLKKSDIYAEIKRSRCIAILVNDALQHLSEGSGSSAKSIKRLIAFKYHKTDDRQLGIQIKKYIRNSLVNGAMIRIKRSFKLKKKRCDRLKEWSKEREKALKHEMAMKIKEKLKVKKAGNIAKTPKPDKANKKISDCKDEMEPIQSPAPKCDQDKSAKKPKLDKSTKEVPKKLQPAGDKPTKTPIKKRKLKKKARKSLNLSQRPNQLHLKVVKKANVMSAVSNMKIQKLQQPMARSRQNTLVRYRPY